MQFQEPPLRDQSKRPLYPTSAADMQNQSTSSPVAPKTAAIYAEFEALNMAAGKLRNAVDELFQHPEPSKPGPGTPKGNSMFPTVHQALLELPKGLAELVQVLTECTERIRSLNGG
jgi:hypothetical protein